MGKFQLAEPSSEGELASHVVMEARRLYNCTLQRNNSGALPSPSGRPVRFGLGNTSPKHWETFRSPDYIGPTVITVTPEMVGKQVAVFTAIETKKPDWVPAKSGEKYKDEKAQANYLSWVKSIGGFAGFAKSVDDLKDIFRSF